MQVLEYRSPKYPFDTVNVNGVICTRGLKFELALNDLQDNMPTELQVKLLKWAYEKFFITNNGKWAQKILANGEMFQEDILMKDAWVKVAAMEVAKNSPLIATAYPQDQGNIEHRFIQLDVEPLFYKGD